MGLSERLSERATELSEFDGHLTAVAYGDVSTELAALIRTAGLVDLGRRRYVKASGEERAEFLHGQLSNDIRGLEAGRGCAALLLTNQGRVLSIVSVLNIGPSLLLSIDALWFDAAVEGLQRYLVADDCEFEPLESSTTIGLVGPQAAAILAEAVTGAHLPGDGWRVSTAELTPAVSSAAGEPVTVIARGDLRVPAFDIIVDQRHAEALWEALEQARAVPVGTAAQEVVRVQSGTARYGVDVDESRIAVEARLEWAIHFNKGCYVGQEVVERAVSRGKLNRRLCLLQLDGPASAGDMVAGGKTGETLTSVVQAGGLTLALAYVGVSRSEDGSRLGVTTATGEVPATVLPWPRSEKPAGL